MLTSPPLLICVVGPTGIGKTALSIKIAQAFTSDIISADSRQFFKEMNIGTAVPSKEELAAATHHFIQHKSIFTPYSVGDFEKDALHTLDSLFKEHLMAVLAGGSGLYVDAAVKGLDSFPDIPSHIREQLILEYNQTGIEPLQKELQKVDPDYYSKVDIYNHHRLIRALEICRGTQKPFSSFLNQGISKRKFKTLFIGLTAERKIIYDRINRRVDFMIKQGLVKEAKSLYRHRNLNALQTVGYRELFEYFDGTVSLETAISEIKKNTRRFAKRQITWFKKNKDIHWFDFAINPQQIIDFIESQV